jgi:hypothetical protein
MAAQQFVEVAFGKRGRVFQPQVNICSGGVTSAAPSA